MDEHPIRILLADDHLLVRAGIAQLLSLQPDMEVVGEAADGLQAHAMAVSLQPDVILMDLEMPRCSGFESIARIRADLPEAVIVVLTYSADQHNIAEAIRAGAQGYLLKSQEPEMLAPSIREAYQGAAPMSGVAVRSLLTDMFRPSPAEPNPTAARPAVEPPVRSLLTARELEILDLVAHGSTNLAVGHRLFLSENTVKNHIKHILAKLHVENRAQAVAWAMQEGLIRR